ncbi:hypothetical protein LCGC14_2455620, partial [marine sediment metagenome]
NTGSGLVEGMRLDSNLLLTIAGLALTGLTTNSLIYPTSGGTLTSLGVATNGKIPIGSTGAAPVLATITGTTNQVISTPGAGSITLSTPQDIHTAASNFTVAGATISDLTQGSVVFAGASGAISQDNSNLFWDDTNNRLGIGTLTIPHGGVGSAKFAIDGTNANVAGPHLQFTTTSDNYPLMQILNWRHDDISIRFDSYWDGANKSSDAGSNYAIFKVSDSFKIMYDSGVAKGAAVAWNDGIVLNTSGLVTFGGAINITTIAAEGSDVDKFLVDSSGVVKYRTGAQVLSDTGGQAADAGLTSLAALTYVSDSFIQLTAEDTYAVKTTAETGAILEADIQHDNLQSIPANDHIDHTTVTLTAGTGLTGGGDISTNRTFDLDINSLSVATIATWDFVPFWDITATATNKKITFANFEGTLNHDALTNFTTDEHFTQAAITTVGTISSGTWEGTTVAINQGGTGQTTAQAAIDSLSAVSGATNEHVLTKDTASGNAIWKVAASGSDVKVGVDVGATAG